MLHRDREGSPTKRARESPAPKGDKYQNGFIKHPQLVFYQRRTEYSEKPPKTELRCDFAANKKIICTNWEIVVSF